LDLYIETVLCIYIKELLCDNAYLSKVINDEKSWLTPREVLNLIHHQFFFIANNMGHQPMMLQYSKSVILQTEALAATAIHSVLDKYPS